MSSALGDAALEVRRALAGDLREVREALPLEALQERGTHEAKHQLDRRRIGNADEQADIGFEEQLERRRRNRARDRRRDPIGWQLVQLLGDHAHLRGPRVRHPRRIVGAADQLHARYVRRDGEVGEWRTAGCQRLGEAALGPRHACEEMQVQRAERGIDQDDALADRREKDADVRGDEALAGAAFAAAYREYPRSHGRGR